MKYLHLKYQTSTLVLELLEIQVLEIHNLLKYFKYSILEIPALEIPNKYPCTRSTGNTGTWNTLVMEIHNDLKDFKYSVLEIPALEIPNKYPRTRSTGNTGTWNTLVLKIDKFLKYFKYSILEIPNKYPCTWSTAQFWLRSVKCPYTEVVLQCYAREIPRHNILYFTITMIESRSLSSHCGGPVI